MAQASSASKGTAASPHHLVQSARTKDLWSVLVGFRIFNALMLATYFQPDEFYQSLEPAWRLAFGKGTHLWMEGAYNGPWITWEWRNQLRSSLYPMLYAGVYKVTGTVCDFLFDPVTRYKLLEYAPKFVQAIGAAVMDFYTYQLAGRVYGPNSNEAWATLLLAVTSPWQWFVSTRSMSNCMETTLTAVALYYWPWEWVKGSTDSKARAKDAQNLKYCVLLAGLASVLRPTNAMIWIVLALFTLPRANQNEFFAMVNAASIWGSAVLALSMGADYLYYGEVTFPPMNFWSVNVEKGISSFYGVNRADYYFTEGVPTLLMTALPFAITGLSQALAGRFLTLPSDTEGGEIHPSILRSLASVALAVPIGLSFIPHKETRFIYPILPILFVIISRPVIAFFHPFPNPTSFVRKSILVSFLATNVVIAVYLGSFHNRGVVGAIKFLRSEHERLNPGLVNHGNTTAVNITTAAVLAPCHSTPWRSHLGHEGIGIWGLTCEPPLEDKSEEEVEDGTYADEGDKFYRDTGRWIRLEFGTQKRAWPDFIVFHDYLRPTIKKMLAKYAFEPAWSGFNSVWHDDWRRQGKVHVWVKTQAYGGPGRAVDPLLDIPEDDDDEVMKLVKEGLAAQSRQTGNFESTAADAAVEATAAATA